MTQRLAGSPDIQTTGRERWSIPAAGPVKKAVQSCA
jgi:hypothetical protein